MFVCVGCSSVCPCTGAETSGAAAESNRHARFELEILLLLPHVWARFMHSPPAAVTKTCVIHTQRLLHSYSTCEVDFIRLQAQRCLAFLEGTFSLPDTSL